MRRQVLVMRYRPMQHLLFLRRLLRMMDSTPPLRSLMRSSTFVPLRGGHWAEQEFIVAALDLAHIPGRLYATAFRRSAMSLDVPVGSSRADGYCTRRRCRCTGCRGHFERHVRHVNGILVNACTACLEHADVAQFYVLPPPVAAPSGATSSGSQQPSHFLM